MITKLITEICPHKKICDKLNNNEFTTCYNPPWAIEMGCEKIEKHKNKRRVR